MSEQGVPKEETTAASNVIRLHPGYAPERMPTKTIIDNTRRNSIERCEHKGPFLVDRTLAFVECEDCGAYLNPIYVLQQLAFGETYWRKRHEDLVTHVTALEKEIEGRRRTRCTHCGNMTAIKFDTELPRTWVPNPHNL